MQKMELDKRLADKNKCFVCGNEFDKDDEIREVFDKAFGQTVRVHKKHYFFMEDKG